MMKKDIFKLDSFSLEEGPSLLQTIWPQINSIISYLKRKKCFHYSISLSYFNHWRCMLCSTYLTKAPPVPHTRWWHFHQAVWSWKHSSDTVLQLVQVFFETDSVPWRTYYSCKILWISIVYFPFLWHLMLFTKIKREYHNTYCMLFTYLVQVWSTKVRLGILVHDFSPIWMIFFHFSYTYSLVILR